MLTGIIGNLVIFGLIIWAVWAFVKRRKKNKLAKLEAQKAFDNMTPAERAEHLRKQEQEKIYFSGKYVGGHPDMAKPIARTNAEVNDPEIVIHSAGASPKTPGPVAFRIPIAAISNVVLEDATTVEKRVTATRLLTVGVFAFGAKKKTVHSEFYVTVTWGTGKIPNETIFEFEGQQAQTNANQWRNIIAKRVNEQVPVR